MTSFVLSPDDKVIGFIQSPVEHLIKQSSPLSKNKDHDNGFLVFSSICINMLAYVKK